MGLKETLPPSDDVRGGSASGDVGLGDFRHSKWLAAFPSSRLLASTNRVAVPARLDATSFSEIEGSDHSSLEGGTTCARHV
jgi:hypothetical protein